eukprot:g15846.t1
MPPKEKKQEDPAVKDAEKAVEKLTIGSPGGGTGKYKASVKGPLFLEKKNGVFHLHSSNKDGKCQSVTMHGSASSTKKIVVGQHMWVVIKRKADEPKFVYTFLYDVHVKCNDDEASVDRIVSTEFVKCNGEFKLWRFGVWRLVTF